MFPQISFQMINGTTVEVEGKKGAFYRVLVNGKQFASNERLAVVNTFKRFIIATLKTVK